MSKYRSVDKMGSDSRKTKYTTSKGKGNPVTETDMPGESRVHGPGGSKSGGKY